MGTSTLHLNNPVPSNGAVAASLGGRHTVTVTLAGVGAISCKVQAWASSNNTDSKMLGAPVVISGTTTVSQTLTFDAGDCNQFWLALVEITPACTFTATVENSGNVQFGGAVLSPAKRNIAPRKGYGTYWISLDTIAAGNTGVVRLQAPPGAIGARFHFPHWGPNPADIVKAGILPVANATANTATSAFTPLKFNGQDGGVIPGWILGKYPAGDKNYAQEIVSDYCAFTAVTRTDYPNRGPLVDVAFKVGARTPYAGVYSPTDSGNTPWVLGWTNGPNDILTTPVSATMYSYMGIYVWAEWVYEGRRRPVAAAFGDSIFDGLSASNIFDGYLQNACYEAGIELYTQACGGRTSFDTWDIMRAELPTLASKVDAVFITAWTPNDEIKGYTKEAVYARFKIEKAWIESMGLRVLVMGPVPYVGSAVPGWIRTSLLADGYEFFDGGKLVATATDLLTWIGGYSNDNIHPNDTSYPVMAGYLRPYLTLCLAPWEAPLYTQYGDLPSAGNQLGSIARVKCLSGTNINSVGYFGVQWTGARWAVVPGSPVVSDNTETSYTSVGTTLTAIKSVVIPAGMIGDGELWEVSEQDTQMSGTNDAAGTHKITLGGTEIWSNTGAITSTPYSFDVVPRRIRRAGPVFKRYTSSLSDSMAVDEINCAANLANGQTFAFSVVPSAIGNVYRARRLYLNRIS